MTKPEYLLMYQKADLKKQQLENNLRTTESRQKLNKITKLLREQQATIQKLTEEAEGQQNALVGRVSRIGDAGFQHPYPEGKRLVPLVFHRPADGLVWRPVREGRIDRETAPAVAGVGGSGRVFYKDGSRRLFDDRGTDVVDAGTFEGKQFNRFRAAGRHHQQAGCSKDPFRFHKIAI